MDDINRSNYNCEIFLSTKHASFKRWRCSIDEYLDQLDNIDRRNYNCEIKLAKFFLDVDLKRCVLEYKELWNKVVKFFHFLSTKHASLKRWRCSIHDYLDQLNNIDRSNYEINLSNFFIFFRCIFEEMMVILIEEIIIMK